MPADIPLWLEWVPRLSLLIGITLWIMVLVRTQPQPIERSESAAVRRNAAVESMPLLRLVLPFVEALGGWYAGRPLSDQRALIERRLVHAEQPAGLTADEWMALRWVSSVGTVLVAGAVWMLVFGVVEPWFLLAAPLGYRLPDLRLKSVIERRVAAVERQLPHALDLFIVCLEAGLSLKEAITLAVPDEGPKDPLTHEFALLARELDFYDFATALARLSTRVPSLELGRLIDTIIESERQGTPYGTVLSAARDSLRRRQSTRVEKAAARAVSAMLLPTVFIFAAVLLVLGGGMALRTMADLPF